MKISSRFTVALHIFTCVETFKNEYKVTSDFLANSIGTNPVIIRKILTQLQTAGLIKVLRGPGGIPQCPVGRNIHTLLDDKLFNIQSAMETEMKRYTLNDLKTGLQEILIKEA